MTNTKSHILYNTIHYTKNPCKQKTRIQHYINNIFNKITYTLLHYYIIHYLYTFLHIIYTHNNIHIIK